MNERRSRTPFSSVHEDCNHGDHCDQRPTDKRAGHRGFERFVVLVGREEFNRGHRPEQADDITKDCRQQSYTNGFHEARRYGANYTESIAAHREFWIYFLGRLSGPRRYGLDK